MEEVLEPVQSDDLPSFAEEVMVEAAVQEGERYAFLQVLTFLRKKNNRYFSLMILLSCVY